MADTELAIIGGGASAVLLLSQLAALPAAAGLRVDLYERSPRLGLGLAYSTQQKVHLLNVRAANMSALQDNKDDFANWVAPRGFDANAFVPRKLYGEYLLEKLEAAKKILNVNIINADVTKVRKISPEEYELEYNFRTRMYRFAVQATGNVRPQRPKVEGKVAWYFDDPWSLDFTQLADMREVALVGSGLTATDMILALYAKKFTGNISIYSRHALPPASHAAPAVYPSFLIPEEPKEGEKPKEKEKLSAYKLLHLIRHHVKEAKKKNIPWQAVIDSIRPHTNDLWDDWTKRERERFMKRLFTLWNVHRHRMAPEIAQAVNVLVKAGRVQFVKSSVDKISAGPVLHGSKGPFKADAVINCLGYRYRDEGYFFEVSEKIGPVRFGEQFETTAIPEIRAQAHEIAARILSKF